MEVEWVKLSAAPNSIDGGFSVSSFQMSTASRMARTAKTIAVSRSPAFCPFTPSLSGLALPASFSRFSQAYREAGHEAAAPARP